MNKKDFPYPKANFPREIRDSKDNQAGEVFHAFEHYLDLVGDYIYTDIDLNRRKDDELHFHAWFLKVLSANLLRSLYLRNAAVDAMNSRNSIGFYLPLKAWFEVAAVMAALLDLLEADITHEERSKRLEPYALGNRGKSSMRVGKIDAVNVVTMMEKGDKYFQRLKGDDDFKENYFSGFYDNASNPSHPSFEANDMVGNLLDGTWKVKSPDEIRQQILELRPHYGGILLAPIFIQHICRKIFSLEKEYFDKVGATKYFS